MKKKVRRFYEPDMSRMIKKEGNYEPGLSKSGLQLESFVRRAGDQNSESYARVMASSYPWLDDVEPDEIVSVTDIKTASLENVTATDLVKLGFEFHDRYKDPDEAEANRILLHNKEELKTHIIEAGNKRHPLFELWVQRQKTANRLPGRVSNITAGRTKTAAKTIKYTIPDSVTRIAWGEAESKGLLSNMIYAGFNVYQSKENKGIWWVESEKDSETGEVRKFLVRKKDVEYAKDAGGGKVDGVVKKVAKKVILTKTAVTTFVKEKGREETSANETTGIGSMVVDVTESSWKKDVEDYIKRCKQNKMIPKKVEVKVIDWTPDED